MTGAMSGNPLTHKEATDLAGLYVLDALSPDQRAEVDAHLESCSKPHPEFDEVGGVVPALATLADPKGAPASLKNQVLADYRAGAGTPAWEPATVSTPAAAARPASRRSSWLGWAAAAVALVLVVVVGAWGFSAQQRADAEAHNSQMLGQALNVMSAQGSMVAVMKGPAGSGFAAVDKNGGGYLVLVDLPAVPDGMTYQAWYIDQSGASSAGLLTVDSHGLAVLALPTKAGATGVALTLEPGGGSPQPTGSIVVKGDLVTHG